MAHVDGEVDGADKGDFSVQIRRREFVTAELPLPESWLPFSNLDLLLSPGFYPGCFFIYEKPSIVHLEFASMLSALKKGLSKLLIPYYPLAGEVVTNPAGEPEVHCNNHGVEFIEAYADIELTNLDLHHPDASVAGKLLPKSPTSLLCLQTTELKCGGMVLGCIQDHRITDGYSANMFLEAWVEMTTTGSISMTPSFRRSLLSPRRSGLQDGSLNDLYMVIAPSMLPKIAPGHEYAGRIYYVKAEAMASLQALASSHGTKRTKVEAFSGCLWKAVARSASDGESCTMIVFVDGRTRMVEDLRSMDTIGQYYGNAVAHSYGKLDASELTNNPLSWVADQVHDDIKSTATRDHFLGLVDLVEANKPHPMMATILYKGTMEGPSFAISHGRLFKTNKLDFGWGSPILGSCYFPWIVDLGYVMTMPSPSGNGDWVVYMHLLKCQFHFVEAELSDDDEMIRVPKVPISVRFVFGRLNLHFLIFAFTSWAS